MGKTKIFVIIQLLGMLLVFINEDNYRLEYLYGDIPGAFLIFGALFQLRGQITPMPEPLPHGKLIQNGVYAYIRHPIYSGILISAIGRISFDQNFYSILGFAILSMALYFKVNLEESFLLRRFPDYRDYMRRTKSLIPFIF